MQDDIDVYIYDVRSHVLWCLPRILSATSSQILLHIKHPLCVSICGISGIHGTFFAGFLHTIQISLFINLLGELTLDTWGHRIRKPRCFSKLHASLQGFGTTTAGCPTAKVIHIGQIELVQIQVYTSETTSKMLLTKLSGDGYCIYAGIHMSYVSYVILDG